MGPDNLMVEFSHPYCPQMTQIDADFFFRLVLSACICVICGQTPDGGVVYSLNSAECEATVVPSVVRVQE